MTAKVTKRYLPFLDGIVMEYNNTVHSTTKMKPIDVTDGSLKDLYEPDENLKKPKYQAGDVVRITKYKNIFAKGFTPNWTHELYLVKKRLDTTPWTYTLENFEKEPVCGTFYEQEMQKSKAKFPGSNE